MFSILCFVRWSFLRSIHSVYFHQTIFFFDLGMTTHRQISVLDEQTRMADALNGDFARLVFCDEITQCLFSATRSYVDENPTYHLRFLQSKVASSTIPIIKLQMNPSSPPLILTIKAKETPMTFKYQIWAISSSLSAKNVNRSFLIWAGEWIEERENHRQTVGQILFYQNLGMPWAGRSLSYTWFFISRDGSGLLMLKGGSLRVLVKYNLDGK